MNVLHFQIIQRRGRWRRSLGHRRKRERVNSIVDGNDGILIKTGRRLSRSCSSRASAGHGKKRTTDLLGIQRDCHTGEASTEVAEEGDVLGQNLTWTSKKRKRGINYFGLPGGNKDDLIAVRRTFQLGREAPSRQRGEARKISKTSWCPPTQTIQRYALCTMRGAR